MEPCQSCNVFVSEVNRVFVKQWIGGYRKARPNRCLLLIGPEGVGKSTLAELCLREAQYTIVHVAAETYRNKKSLEQALKDATRLPLKQAVLVEDPHMLVADGGLQVLAKFCKQASRIPVIIICAASKKGKMQQLTSCAEKVMFKPMAAKQVAHRFGAPADVCKGGDLRQVCTYLQSRLPWFQRDWTCDVQEAGFKLLEGQAVNDGLRMYRVDCQALGNIVHANFTDLVRDMRTAADVAHDLSTADVFGADMEDMAGIVGTVTAGNRIQTAPTKPRPDLLWTKSSLRQTRMRGLASSSAAFVNGGNTLDLWSATLIRDKMLHAAVQGQAHDVLAWAPDATLQQLTNVMRLGIDSSKNEAVINKFRRNMKKQSLTCDTCC